MHRFIFSVQSALQQMLSYTLPYMLPYMLNPKSHDHVA